MNTTYQIGTTAAALLDCKRALLELENALRRYLATDGGCEPEDTDAAFSACFLAPVAEIENQLNDRFLVEVSANLATPSDTVTL